jgi:outer membrane protein
MSDTDEIDIDMTDTEIGATSSPVAFVGSRGCSWVRAGVLACVALVAASVPGAGAQTSGEPVPPRELTVEESVRLGVERSARVRAVEAEAAEAQAMAREARAALWPALRAQGSYAHLGGDIPAAEFVLPGLDTTFTLLPIERDRYHGEVSVEQPLFVGGRLRHGARSAERRAAAAEWTAEQARADVALEVRVAYWTLQGALVALEATEATLAGIEEHLRDVRRRFDEGAVLRSEVLAAQTRRSEVLLERVEAGNAVRVGRLELNRLLGLPDTAEVRLAPGIELAPGGEPGPAIVPAPGPGVVPAAPPELAEQALSERPELRAMAAQVEGLRALETAARGGRLPEVALVSRYIYARPNPYVFTEQGEFRGTWEAGVSVRWNLWEGGAQSARVKQARERVRAAEARLEDALELAVVEVSRQYLEARRAAEAVGVAAEHVEHAAESLRVTRQQWAEGVALSAQVLDAEAAYRWARARHARAQAEDAIARAALLRALGRVW